MLVAEFKWLLGKLPVDDENRVRIQTAYGDEIDSACSDGKTIDIFSVDKHTLPNLLLTMGCPKFPADRRFPFPPGALLDMPHPLTAAEGGAPITIDNEGRLSHIATTLPMPATPDLFAFKGVPGGNFELAAAMSFMERPENAHVRLEDYLAITDAYRPREKQHEGALTEEHDLREATKQRNRSNSNDVYPDALQLCTKHQLGRLEDWYSAADFFIGLPGGMVVSSQDIQRLGQGRNLLLNTNMVNGVMGMLRNHIATLSPCPQIEILDFERSSLHYSEQDVADWLEQADQMDVTSETFDQLTAVLIPLQTGSHFSLILMLPQEKHIVVFNPDAPLSVDGCGRFALECVRTLTGSTSTFTVKSAVASFPQGLDVCGLLVCYYAALYVARGVPATLGYIGEPEVESIAHWLAVSLIEGGLKEDKEEDGYHRWDLDVLRLPSAIPADGAA